MIIDATGCSIEQLVPCHGPWRNHGEYLNALRKVISQFLGQGLINEEQAGRIFKAGTNSECGKQ